MPELIPIHDLNAPELAVYTRLNENQLRHYYEPRPEGLFIAESPTVIERALDAGYEPVSLLLEEKYVQTEAAGILERLARREAAWSQAEEENARQVGTRGQRGAADQDQKADQTRTTRQEGAGNFGRTKVYTAPIEVLSQLTGYHLNRGILGAFRRKILPSVEDVCRDAHRIVILDNVENPTNVGAIFRSAAALGMDAVLMTPTSADPLQRRAIRVGVGTVFQLPWTYIGEDLTPAHARAMGLLEKGTAAGTAALTAAGLSQQAERSPAWPDRGMARLHQLGFQTVAMALRHDTISIDDPCLHQIDRLAILMGNEGDGLPERTLSLCDHTIRIPMSHGVDSLNVAAASAVAFWELGKAPA